MNWLALTAEAQFAEALKEQPLFGVFKHSTRCSISNMAKNRLERDWRFDFPIYYLDLLNYRPISNLIADASNVQHESPQLIVFQNGKAIYAASHNGIVMDDVQAAITKQ